MSVRDWFAAGLQLVTNQLSAMKLDQLKRFRRLLYSWFKFTRTRQVKVSYQATSIQKPVLDCLCPLRDCLLFTKDRLILVSIILAAAKTCGFSAGLVTGRSLHQPCPAGACWADILALARDRLHYMLGTISHKFAKSNQQNNEPVILKICLYLLGCLSKFQN